MTVDASGWRGIESAFHPAEFIEEEMEARGWSRDDLAIAMGGDEPLLERLALDLYLDVGPRESGIRLGAESAKKLGSAFDVSAEYFLNLEKSWLASVRDDRPLPAPPPHD